MTDALPDNTGYVAAAYLVFLGLVLIYVAIMAAKLARLHAELAELDELADLRASEREKEDYGRPEGERLHQDAGLEAPRR